MIDRWTRVLNLYTGPIGLIGDWAVGFEQS